ncbi:hypothetical protein OQA88_2492 [Cercophora sp. LCS_1]
MSTAPFDPSSLLETLNAKIRANNPLTTCEARFLLRTGFLPYKSLLFPTSLTPAEHNRVLNRPSPSEVSANIQTVTSGDCSTPDEFLQKALDDAYSMGDELNLIIHRFYLADSVYKTTSHLRWIGKLGDMGDLALDRLISERDREAGNKAWRSHQEETREARRMGSGKRMTTSEERRLYHEGEQRTKRAAAQDTKRLDTKDEVLFDEVRSGMEEMAEELDEVVCGCEDCLLEGERFRTGDGRVQVVRAGDGVFE